VATDVSSVVIQPDPTVVRARLEAEFVRLLDVLSACRDVEQVWRFGSTVDGRPHATSDLDVLVVQRTPLGPVERAVALRLLLAPTTALDLFVLTPDELDRGGRFVDHVIARGRRER
jgi:predicted nucleotidyltransferase